MIFAIAAYACKLLDRGAASVGNRVGSGTCHSVLHDSDSNNMYLAVQCSVLLKWLGRSC